MRFLKIFIKLTNVSLARHKREIVVFRKTQFRQQILGQITNIISL